MTVVQASDRPVCEVSKRHGCPCVQFVWGACAAFVNENTDLDKTAQNDPI